MPHLKTIYSTLCAHFVGLEFQILLGHAWDAAPYKETETGVQEVVVLWGLGLAWAWVLGQIRFFWSGSAPVQPVLPDSQLCTDTCLHSYSSLCLVFSVGLSTLFRRLISRHSSPPWCSITTLSPGPPCPSPAPSTLRGQVAHPRAICWGHASSQNTSGGPDLGHSELCKLLSVLSVTSLPTNPVNTASGPDAFWVKLQPARESSLNKTSRYDWTSPVSHGCVPFQHPDLDFGKLSEDTDGPALSSVEHRTVLSAGGEESGRRKDSELNPCCVWFLVFLQKMIVLKRSAF